MARVALVTGAGRGIGRAIALRLAADGHDIAVNDVNADGAESVAREVRSAGRRAVAVPGDVSDRETVFGVVADAVSELGGLHTHVNNAGVAQVKPLLEVEPAELEQLFRVNVFGVVYGLQAAAEHMREHGGGKIINAASIAGHAGFDYLGAYSGTKFGVVGITQAAAKELAQHGITVNAYCPGIVGTDMWDDIDARLGGYLGLARGAAMEQYAQGIALGRVQTPEDVAGFVAYLAGPDADYMTGQSVVIDGGVVMR
ncbi:acetoin reductase [Saccharopolyspora griseoalba]|uniref:diacetyl reductase [(S)-acetoin forming] n=1 Tax=Saccharopolyspora griseoalba TaxID=1431848 RepID=A0ABW2LPB5_9PSEU